MKNLLILILSFSSLGCVTGYNPRYYFNEVQVVNLTTAEIEDVQVSIPGTSTSLFCDEVAKNAICDDRYGRRAFPQQGIELSWIHPNDSRKSGLFTPAIPVTFNASFPLRIVLEVNADGVVNAFFEQDEPSREGNSLFNS